MKEFMRWPTAFALLTCAISISCASDPSAQLRHEHLLMAQERTENCVHGHKTHVGNPKFYVGLHKSRVYSLLGTPDDDSPGYFAYLMSIPKWWRPASSAAKYDFTCHGGAVLAMTFNHDDVCLEAKWYLDEYFDNPPGPIDHRHYDL